LNFGIIIVYFGILHYLMDEPVYNKTVSLYYVVCVTIGETTGTE